MDTRWKVTGENVREKLEPYLNEQGLSYRGLDRRNRHMYDLSLETFKQYEDLEKLMNNLDLELTISIGAEWLAVLYTDKFGLSKSV